MINLVCWVLGMYLVVLLIALFFMRAIREEFGRFIFCVCLLDISTLYFSISFLSLFFEGLFLNSDLTPEQKEFPTESWFTLFFYVFAMMNLVFYALASFLIVLLQAVIVCIIITICEELRRGRG